MGKKATKSTRKFAASGQLQKTIQTRRKHQEIRRKTQSKQKRKDARPKHSAGAEGAEEADSAEESAPRKNKSKVKSVDDFLSGAFMDDDASDNEVEEDDDDMDDDEDDDDVGDDQSFASIDDLDDEGATHLMELSKLAEKDPEFYKYLQENDRELLDFDMGQAEDDDEDMDDAGDSGRPQRAPALTADTLRKWQRALLQQHSLRALRKLLIAFRSAAHMNEEGEGMVWSIDSSTVYSKVVTTALRYTPVVLEHHVPYKTLSDGRFKPPTQTPKQRTLSKLVLSFFYNIVRLMEQLSDDELLKLAISESARLLPYVITSRKAIKLYLKALLNAWSTGADSVRIAAIVAVRRLCMSTDNSIMDTVYKALYLTLVRYSKQTSAHSLPSINLMKNSASEIYCLDAASAYQHAFGYIRQLAVHLRNSMKVKTKEAYKQVYNWQYVHSIDFWSLVLARACDATTSATQDNELRPLIYPLVQVTLGAVKLVSASRSYPLHCHLIRSLVHLVNHTHVYVPLSPYILPMITSTLTSSKHKSSTLKPLDMDTAIRAPQQYIKTRVYTEEVADEATFLLAEWLSTPVVQCSIAFPEIVVPVVVLLRKMLKAAKSVKGKGPGKEAATVRTLVERIEESAKWIDAKRRGVQFSPAQTDQVANWERQLKVEDSPLAKFVKVQRKAREKRRTLLDKARKGEGEMIEE